MKYIVGIDEIYGYSVEVDAESEEHAKEKATDLLEELSIENSQNRETKIISVTEKE